MQPIIITIITLTITIAILNFNGGSALTLFSVQTGGERLCSESTDLPGPALAVEVTRHKINIVCSIYYITYLS